VVSVLDSGAVGFMITEAGLTVVNYERRVTLRYAVGGARSRDGATNHSGVPAVLNVLERASQTHEICSSASLP